jgi:hypothetical protein
MESNKSTLLTAGATVLVVLALMFWLGMSSAGSKTTVNRLKASSEASVLIAAETAFDFGDIRMKDGDVSKEFTVVNSTSTDITIKKIATSCMCTRAYFEGPLNKVDGPFGMEGMGGQTSTYQTIKPGEEFTIKVVYDPNAHGPAGVGTINRAVFITDSEGRTLTLAIKAVVTP